MKIEKFILDFASQFDETPFNEFYASTTFHNIEEWDSMIALSIMAMIDENYNVKIKPDEIKSAKTIQDVFNIVSSKKNSL